MTERRRDYNVQVQRLYSVYAVSWLGEEGAGYRDKGTQVNCRGGAPPICGVPWREATFLPESGATATTVTAAADSLYRTQPTSPGSAIFMSCGTKPRGSQSACVEADHTICDVPKYFVF